MQTSTDSFELRLKENSKFNAERITVAEGSVAHLTDIVSADKIILNHGATLIAPNLKTVSYLHYENSEDLLYYRNAYIWKR